MLANMIFSLSVIAGLTLLALGEAFQVIMFSIAASGFWLIVGAFGFINSTGIWDMPYFLGWMGMAMAMASGLHAVTIRNRVGSFTSDAEDKEHEQPERRLSFREKIVKRQQQQRKKRADDFAKTGKM